MNIQHFATGILLKRKAQQHPLGITAGVQKLGTLPADVEAGLRAALVMAIWQLQRSAA